MFSDCKITTQKANSWTIIIKFTFSTIYRRTFSLDIFHTGGLAVLPKLYVAYMDHPSYMDNEERSIYCTTLEKKGT